MTRLLEKYFQFIKRLMLSQGENSTLGLDISSGVCRVVELRRKQDSFEVVRWAMEPVEGTDEKSALMRLLEKMGPLAGAKTCVVSVSGKGTLIRHIEMPRMSFPDLRKAFALESDKYFPFPKETIFPDCFILDQGSKEKKMPVIVAAVKKDVVEARLKLLKECGIEPVGITLSSVAVANSFAVLPPPICTSADLNGKAVAVIDIGETTVNLMIISDGLPRFSRDIFMGVSDIWRRVSNVIGITVPQARALGAVGGSLPVEHATELHKAVEAVLMNIIAEVRLSFDYFNTEKNMPVGRICLIGDGVFVVDVETLFMAQFDIPFVKWNPADMLHVAADANRDGFVQEGRRMVAALGLALSDYD